MTLAGKKLLIMGGNAETGLLVDTANRLGIVTIVVDPNPAAPAKKYAARSYERDGFDIDGIVAIARKERVDGVLVGVADILVLPYAKVCAKLRLPCYATTESAIAFTGKDHFRNLVRRYEIQSTPSFDLDSSLDSANVSALRFPLMLKPVDNGAGVGMVVCKDRESLRGAVAVAVAHSVRGSFLAERYMDCDDTFAYYTMCDGKVHLSAMADRITTRKQETSSRVCLAARYPSKHLSAFDAAMENKVESMVKGVGVRNGVLNIQFWVEDGTFYAYDPGFRLQGEAPHIYLKHFYGLDHREMLLRFALTGDMGGCEALKHCDAEFGGRVACTLWFLLTAGVIRHIDGMEAIRSDPNVISVMQRFAEGDEVTQSMIGTERQVFARVYIAGSDEESLFDAIRRVNDCLLITDEQGRDMILEKYQPNTNGAGAEERNEQDSVRRRHEP